MKNTILRSYLKKILRSEAFISVVVVFVLALGIIGTSYALYMDVDTDTDYQLVEVGDLRIDFDHNENSDNPNDYNKIDLENVTPMEDDIAITQENNIFSFRIYNSGTYDVDYKIKLVTADGNQIDTQYINYQICKDNATCNNINTLSNSSDSVIRTGQIKTINENETNSDYYFLRVWINNRYPEELWTSDNNLVLRIMIEASNTSERSLAYNILKNAKSGIEGRSVFTEPDDLPTTPAEDVSGENERILSYTEDDLGTSYYFRGNVNDNYVNFAGMCWRIVRIQGDGSVKLILEDQNVQCDNPAYDGNWVIGIGNYGYDSSSKSTSGSTLYKMNYLNPVTNNTSSMVKAFYDFQTTKLADYTGKLKSGDWCLGDKAYTRSGSSGSYTYTLLEDTSSNYLSETSFYYDAYTRLTSGNANGYQPTLKCNGTILNEFADVSGVSSKSPMYVSAITVDEIVYAGGKNGVSNYNYYLMNNYSKHIYYFWSLSPRDFSSTYDHAFNVHIDGSLVNLSVNNNNYLAFRPSVSLASSVSVTSGEGTLEKPYVID